MVTTTLAPRAASAGVAATRAPSWATSSALARVRLYTWTAWPRRIRLRAMPRPISPVPTNPIVRPMPPPAAFVLTFDIIIVDNTHVNSFRGRARGMLIEKEVLRDKICDVLRAWILEGKLKPGERIVEL